MNIKSILGITPKPTPTLTLSRAEQRRQTKAHLRAVPECIAIDAGRDGIPVEVANSMLTTPGVKLTSRMRKNCMASRETVFVSTREPKTFEIRLAKAAQAASASQLLKWARRVVIERGEVTRDYYRLKTKLSNLDPLRLHDIAKARRTLAIMDVTAQRLDAEMASYRTEAMRRLIKSDVFKANRD